MLISYSVFGQTEQIKNNKAGVFDIKKIDISSGDLGPQTYSRDHNMMAIILKAPESMRIKVLQKADNILNTYTNVAVFHFIDKSIEEPIENFMLKGNYITNNGDPNMPWGFLLLPEKIKLIEQANIEAHDIKKK
ncbi:MAG: hypothetical protein JJ978_13470 [Roseivirga sp.]|uniref:hypothetical protein n=1 Tax=Roseivirga sp. TaxID=1964215 RepID=UPI001B0D6C4B|nr:hypothetical protein [Roseivirga sp.]MBO6496576.1 hypothetical protein [Roseivirga sp.]